MAVEVSESDREVKKMKVFRREIFAILLFLSLFSVMSLFAEPLQNDLFVVLRPDGIMGGSFTHGTFKVADSADAECSAIYDCLKNSPELKKVFEMYRDSQTGGDPNKKALPLNLVVQKKGLMLMNSFSGYITTYGKDGKLNTDYQYVCPKIDIPLSSDNFAVDPKKLSDPSARMEFMNGIAHETAHAIMKQTYGYIPKGLNPFAAFGHWQGQMSTNQLAFTEGYAEFMGAHFSGDSLDDSTLWRKEMGDNTVQYPKTREENMKTEGVVASIFWDIAKLPDGFNKIHRVLKEKKPWTIECMVKDFKEMFPSDAAAIDAIMDENLTPVKDSIIGCWLEIKNMRAQIENLEKEIAATGNPITKTSKFIDLQKAKGNYRNLLNRYISIYGYTEEVLTSATRPVSTRQTGINSGAVNVISSGTSPFSE
ncbi:MAG: hypothetical protein HQM10_07605 [Candidatus Riflebacteria bacterium]|nr:hypothetical protein [Candidatus Riflebacteria bacterium]